MRITGGTRRGRILTGPDDDTVRPTSDKARLAIFNMLEARGAVRDAVVLDVFCGTGALGIEAISRGAARAVLMDSSTTSVALALKNVRDAAFDGQMVVLSRDATNPGAPPTGVPPATLVFLDPPYGQGLVLPTLQSLYQNGWIAGQDAFIVIETEREFAPSAWPDWAEHIQTKVYGVAGVHLLRTVFHE
jgi:16S rRNA (guanine966-N2)-methyltransferase